MLPSDAMRDFVFEVCRILHRNFTVLIFYYECFTACVVDCCLPISLVFMFRELLKKRNSFENVKGNLI